MATKTQPSTARDALLWTWATLFCFLFAGCIVVFIGTGTPAGTVLATIGAILIRVAISKTVPVLRGGNDG